MTHRQPDEEGNAIRGLVYAVLFSLPIWALIIAVIIWWNTTH